MTSEEEKHRFGLCMVRMTQRWKPDSTLLVQEVRGLTSHFRQPGRHHVTFTKLVRCLLSFQDAFLHQVECDDPVLVMWAVVFAFHDHEYRPTEDDEVLGADAAAACMMRLGIADHSFLSRLKIYLLALKHRELDNRPDHKLLFDLATSVLAVPPEEFEVTEQTLLAGSAHKEWLVPRRHDYFDDVLRYGYRVPYCAGKFSALTRPNAERGFSMTLAA